MWTRHDSVFDCDYVSTPTHRTDCWSVVLISHDINPYIIRKLSFADNNSDCWIRAGSRLDGILSSPRYTEFIKLQVEVKSGLTTTPTGRFLNTMVIMEIDNKVATNYSNSLLGRLTRLTGGTSARVHLHSSCLFPFLCTWCEQDSNLRLSPSSDRFSPLNYHTIWRSLQASILRPTV